MPIVETQIQRQRRRLAVHGALIFSAGLALGFLFMFAQDTSPPSPEDVHRWRVAHLQGLTHGILLIALAAGSRYIDLTGSQLRFAAWAAVIGAWGAVSASTLSAAWGVDGRKWKAPIENEIAFVIFGIGVGGVCLAFTVLAVRGIWDSYRALRNRPKWKNWAGTVDAHPRRIERPTTREDLVRAVQDALRDDLKIRAAGASYSWSPVAATDGALIDCSALTRCLEIGHEEGGGFIRVEAGVSIDRLSKLAAAEGLTLESTTVIPWVLVGGAVANGCHGTGVKHRHFTDLVRSMELVDARGSLVSYTRPPPLGASPTPAEREARETWEALTVSLGTLGIIYSLTFDCVPMFNVLAVDHHADMRETLDDVENLVEKNDYAEVFWFPYRKRVWVKTWNKTSEPPTGASAARAWSTFKQAFQNKLLGPVVLNLISLAPGATPLMMRLFFHMVGKGRQVSPLPDALQYQTRFMKAVDMGYAIPIDDGYENVRRAWYAVVDRLENLKREHIYPQNLVMHLRFVGSGDGLLAPSAGRDRSCYIEILTYHNTAFYPEYFAAVEQDWIKLGGRSHWAKLCFAPESLADTYRDGNRDRGKEFLAIRAKHDPKEVFVNDWIRTVLGM